MKILAGGAAVIAEGALNRVEGTRRFRVPISQAMGARDIAQTVSAYSAGLSHARRNPVGEEVLYVVRGEGACYVDGFCYELASGAAVLVPPCSVFQIENNDRQHELEIVSVCCPEDEQAETVAAPVTRNESDPKPVRVVREQQQKAIPTGDRVFKLLVSEETGAKRVTQFIGVIPPGRAPMHHHTYEEAIYIIQGEGRLLTDEGSAEFQTGASIYLPRGVSHSLENTGSTDIRLLGVFHPRGSPAARYDD